MNFLNKKITLDGINSILDNVQEKISEPEDLVVEIIWNEILISELWDNINDSIFGTWVLGRGFDENYKPTA